MANGIRAEYAKRAEANTIRQDDLFGADETFNTEMALRAKYAGDQIARINLDLRALKIVSGKQSGNVAAKDTLLKKYNIKGPDDTAGIERAIQELETLHHRWQHYYTDPELSKEADAFVKKSLRLDPEDQPPVVIVQPDANDSRFTIHDSPAGQSPASPEPAAPGGNAASDSRFTIHDSPAAPAASADELPLGNAASDARQGVPESPASPESPAPSGKAAPAQPLPELPHGINDEQANGSRFVPLAKNDNFDAVTTDALKKRKRFARNSRLGTEAAMQSSRDAKKVGFFTKSYENNRAHQYAAKNILALYAQANVAIRSENYKTHGKGSGPKTYVRLFAPFLFEGRPYVAVIAQYEADKNGIHAVEVLDTVEADRLSEVRSRETQRDAVPTERQTASNANNIPQSNESVNRDRSVLAVPVIDRLIGETKGLNPRRLDPGPDGKALIETQTDSNTVIADVRADLADFLTRARYRADHKLQPIDADDVGRFTMGEGVTIEVSDNTATVAGLAVKSPAEADKLLDAVQAQLAPGVAIAADDRPAPAIQAAIQAHNEAAQAQRVWDAIDQYNGVSYRVEDGKHILTFPQNNTRTYQENEAIVKAVKAILPQNPPLTLENTKSRFLRAIAEQTTPTAQPAPETTGRGAAPHPESQASNPPNLQTSGGIKDAAIPDTPKAQRDAVRSRHQGRASWLKAPNGKRSNLPKNLWVDVRTPNFKRFFGDWENHPETIHPKLLDENGEPRIFWHNSDTPGIRAFDPTRSRAAMDIQGTYFSPDRQDAAGYGQNAYPVFIALKRPADQATAYAGFTPGSTPDAGAIRAQELRDQGYDGVIVEDSDYDSGIAEIIVLDPNAIKSAGSNSGAYDPSTPDILANQAPTTQAPSPTPVAPTGAPPFSVLRSPFSGNGIDAVSYAVYPNGGRVPVAGSPAATAGTLPLSLPHAVQLFHLLTGKLPGVVAQKNRGPRNALGWFLPKTGDAFVRAQLFGLIDKSDLTVLKDGLAKRGFFRHENPAWCVTQTKDSIRREKTLSNQKLAKAADLLIRRRTRAGVHQGAAAKVMAHELWHAKAAPAGRPENRERKTENGTPAKRATNKPTRPANRSPPPRLSQHHQQTALVA